MSSNNFIIPENLSINSYELILTENCNLRCKYCFDNSFSNRTKCNYNYVMKLEMIPDILSFIEKTKGNNRYEDISITFFGGEPLLNFNFIKKFIETAKENRMNFSYGMNSNMTFLTRDIIDFLVENRVNCCASIDGDNIGHNATRIYPNGLGSWEDVVSKLPYFISKYHSHNLPITAMMVVDKNNYTRLIDNYNFLLKVGFDSINILWNFESNFSDEQIKDIQNSLIELFIIQKAPLYMDLKRRVLNLNYHKADHYCQLVTSNCTINCSGDLFFCHRLVPKMSDEYKFTQEKFGNIYEGYTNLDFFNFINHRTHMEDYLNTSEDIPCKTCEALKICHGGCIGAIRDNTSGYKNLPGLCKIQKMLYNTFIKENF